MLSIMFTYISCCNYYERTLHTLLAILHLLTLKIFKCIKVRCRRSFLFRIGVYSVFTAAAIVRTLRRYSVALSARWRRLYNHRRESRYALEHSLCKYHHARHCFMLRLNVNRFNKFTSNHIRLLIEFIFTQALLKLNFNLLITRLIVRSRDFKSRARQLLLNTRN